MAKATKNSPTAELSGAVGAAEKILADAKKSMDGLDIRAKNFDALQPQEKQVVVADMVKTVVNYMAAVDKVMGGLSPEADRILNEMTIKLNPIINAIVNNNLDQNVEVTYDVVINGISSSQDLSAKEKRLAMLMVGQTGFVGANTEKLEALSQKAFSSEAEFNAYIAPVLNASVEQAPGAHLRK